MEEVCTFFCGYLVKFRVIWCIFFHFGIKHQEKSGNPDVLLLNKNARNDDVRDRSWKRVFNKMAAILGHEKSDSF
jgi:hypothetical protein